ncbi:MAG TPA: amino acid racemase [Desulfomonilaceae bacterium]|nr:amino acid racemase [Desulfomonilaceae bacterium]
MRATPAKGDQDRLKVLIFSNPQIPDRTAAIQGEGSDPLPALVASAEVLVKAGASFQVIPCITAHHFYDRLQRALPVPILHIIGETAAALAAERPEVRLLGLPATSGTVKRQLFESYLEPGGLTVFSPDPKVQFGPVMQVIHAVKGADTSEAPRRLIREAAEHLILRGAEVVCAGCTEVPLILRDGDLSVPVVDSTWVLAQAAVRLALAEDHPLAPVLRGVAGGPQVAAARVVPEVRRHDRAALGRHRGLPPPRDQGGPRLRGGLEQQDPGTSTACLWPTG